MSMQDYVDALNRLKAGKPTRVPKGTKITNDSVSLEAGRSKGSIKKSRLGFAQLINDIDEAAAKQSESRDKEIDRIAKLASRVLDLEKMLDAALAREMSLVYELFETKKKLAKMTDSKVFPIKARRNEENGSAGLSPLFEQ